MVKELLRIWGINNREHKGKTTRGKSKRFIMLIPGSWIQQKDRDVIPIYTPTSRRRVNVASGHLGTRLPFAFKFVAQWGLSCKLGSKCNHRAVQRNQNYCFSVFRSVPLEHRQWIRWSSKASRGHIPSQWRSFCTLHLGRVMGDNRIYMNC